MNRSARTEKPHPIVNEIETQLQMLQELSRFYCSADGVALLEQLHPGGRYLFVGDGSAQLAAKQCTAQAIDAAALEVDDLSRWPAELCKRFDRVFVFASTHSQSDFKHFSASQVVLLAPTSKTGAPNVAGLVLPTFFSEAQWPGSQPFLARGVLTWLLSRRLSARWDGSEADQLKHLRQRSQLLIEGRPALLEQWQRCLAGKGRLFLTGSGIQAILAAQAAISLSQWTELLATNLPWGSPLPTGRPDALSITLLGTAERRLTDSVTLIDGYPLLPADPPRPGAGLESGLGCFLNWISLQLLADGFSGNR
jgi:hypothetical protein